MRWWRSSPWCPAVFLQLVIKRQVTGAAPPTLNLINAHCYLSQGETFDGCRAMMYRASQGLKLCKLGSAIVGGDWNFAEQGEGHARGPP